MPLAQAQIEEAAAYLLHLRVQHETADQLPFEIRPTSIDDAYAIQDQLLRTGGWEIGVLKVGCTSDIAQQILEIPHPIGGRVPAEGRFSTGANVPAAFFSALPSIECEIALQVDDEGRATHIAPAMEIIDRRILASGLVTVADNSAAAAVIIGAPVGVDEIDVASIDVALTCGDDVRATGTPAAVIGGPTASVEWILAHEAARGRTVAGGSWIITGTCTGIAPTALGETYVADFGPLGSVSFSLVA